MKEDIRLVRVQPTQIEALKEYVIALYEHDDDFDSMINVEEGVNSLMKNEDLAVAYFIKQGDQRVGYTILSKYHSVEKGGLTVYIDELYVQSQYRRKKVGSRVMESIFQLTHELGAKWLWAQTDATNEGAQEFFVNHGFKQNTQKSFERPLG